jgi:hypothetical protein
MSKPSFYIQHISPTYLLDTGCLVIFMEKQQTRDLTRVYMSVNSIVFTQSLEQALVGLLIAVVGHSSCSHLATQRMHLRW